MALRHYTSFSLLICVAAFTTLLLGETATAGGVEAEELCQDTDYPSLCRAIVKGKPTVASATHQAVKATILQAMQAKSMAVKLGANKRGIEKSNIDTCKELYDDAIYNLGTSMKNIKNGAKADLNINLSAALTDFVTCDDGFAETPGAVSPLGKVNSLLTKLTSDCLALASEKFN